ncbi:hypothetical protein GCM10010377_70960 [Streptomyces viridiviolaceus]|nr:hypothetical protein GCM10010377_70960 [Streptomyces viridiviolaceus]
MADLAARRVLLQKCELGLLDEDWTAGAPGGTGPVDLDSPANGALARRLAEESVVLLDNPDGLLPLAPDTRIAVVGPRAWPATGLGRPLADLVTGAGSRNRLGSARSRYREEAAMLRTRLCLHHHFGRVLDLPREEKDRFASPTGHPYRGRRQWPDDFGRLELERSNIGQYDDVRAAEAAGLSPRHAPRPTATRTRSSASPACPRPVRARARSPHGQLPVRASPPFP